MIMIKQYCVNLGAIFGFTGDYQLHLIDIKKLLEVFPPRPTKLF